MFVVREAHTGECFVFEPMGSADFFEGTAVSAEEFDFLGGGSLVIGLETSSVFGQTGPCDLQTAQRVAFG